MALKLLFSPLAKLESLARKIVCRDQAGSGNQKAGWNNCAGRLVSSSAPKGSDG